MTIYIQQNYDGSSFFVFFSSPCDFLRWFWLFTPPHRSVSFFVKKNICTLLFFDILSLLFEVFPGSLGILWLEHFYFCMRPTNFYFICIWHEFAVVKKIMEWYDTSFPFIMYLFFINFTLLSGKTPVINLLYFLYLC